MVIFSVQFIQLFFFQYIPYKLSIIASLYKDIKKKVNSFVNKSLLLFLFCNFCLYFYSIEVIVQ